MYIQVQDTLLPLIKAHQELTEDLQRFVYHLMPAPRWVGWVVGGEWGGGGVVGVGARWWWVLGGGVVVVGARWWWRGEGVDMGGVVGCGGWVVEGGNFKGKSFW